MAAAKKKPAKKKPAKEKKAAPAKKKPAKRPSTRPSASLRTNGGTRPSASLRTSGGTAKRPSTRPSASLRTNGGTRPSASLGTNGGKKTRPSASRRTTGKLPPLVVIERDRTRLLQDGEHFGPTAIALHTIGQLELSSGQIVTVDPFIVDGPALARSVMPGSYPVTLSVATFDGENRKGDQRVAAATVQFRPGTPERWEVASFVESSSKRAVGDPGFPVDAGTACFMDADAQAAIKAEPTHWPTPSQKALEQQLLTDHYVHTWGWAVYRPDPATKANCVAFMSGYGDGIYSSYWGLDASGAPLCLMTDFDVFTDEEWTAT